MIINQSITTKMYEQLSIPIRDMYSPHWPLIFKLGKTYYPSIYEKDTIDPWAYYLCIDLPDYPKFEFHCLKSCSIVVRKSVKQMQQNRSTAPYRAYVVHEQMIVEESDMSDFYLICVTHEKLEINDEHFILQNFYIYHNFNLVLTISDVTEGLFYNSYNFDFNNIEFVKLIDRESAQCCRYKWDGHDFVLTPILTENLTFYDWCTVHRHFHILELYTKQNDTPVKSSKLLWNDVKVVKWECNFGHIWEDPISKITENSVSIYPCPICKKIRESSQHSIVESEILEILDRLKHGELYEDGYKNYPNDIKFIFTYPLNKQSEIAMYLSQTEGNLQQIDFKTYSLTYNPSEIEKIVRMDYCMHLMQGFYLMKTSGDKTFVCDHSQAEEFLNQYFLYSIMYKLQRNLAVYLFPHRKDSVSSIAQETSRNYHDNLKQNINSIYSQMVEEGVDNGVWVSERQLFTLVRNSYKDALFQYKSHWLGQQSLDIFIPSICVAFEYQGQQHYEPVDFFGGETAFEERLILDDKKRHLCVENNIKLIEWKWHEEICFKNLYHKLQAIGINITKKT